MRISPSLVADLALLSEVLDGPEADIAETLAVLVSQTVAAVPSYAGISLRLHYAETPFEVTTVEDAAQVARVRTWLRLTPPAGPAPEISIVLIVYAARAGALVDLAADLAWLTGRDLGEVLLDAEGDGPGPVRETASLVSMSTTNQAVGVLIGRGLTPEGARAEIERRALESGARSQDVAAEILAALAGEHRGG